MKANTISQRKKLIEDYILNEFTGAKKKKLLKLLDESYHKVIEESKSVEIKITKPQMKKMLKNKNKELHDAIEDLKSVLDETESKESTITKMIVNDEKYFLLNMISISTKKVFRRILKTLFTAGYRKAGQDGWNINFSEILFESEWDKYKSKICLGTFVHEKNKSDQVFYICSIDDIQPRHLNNILKGRDYIKS